MDDNKAAFVKVYHAASGLSVSVPLSLDSALTAATISESIGALLAGGLFTATLAGQVEGDRTDISNVVRGQGSNRDGGTTDRIWMYTPWGDADKGSQLTVYLNTPDDVAAFEKAAGLKVENLPVCKGNAAPRRESGDFEQKSRKVQFSIIRAKEEDEKSIAGYKWVLKQYIGGAPALPLAAPPPQPTASAPTPTTVVTQPPQAAPLKVLNGEDPKSFGQMFKPSAPPTVGSLDMHRLLNRALELKLVKTKPQFEERVHDLKASGAIRDASSEKDVLDALGNFETIMRTSA